MRAVASWIIAFGVIGSGASAAPVQVLHQSDVWSYADAAKVLFTDGDLAVVAADSATAQDVAELYAVNMSNRLSAESLRPYGEVLHFAPRHFGLMRLSSPQVAALSAKLHAEGLACGVLTKLSLEHAVTHRLAAAPAAMLAPDSVDPRVQKVVAGVSQDRLAGTIDELAAMPTRFADTGTAVATLLAKKYEALRGQRDDVSISLYDHGEATPQNSLIVRIQGTTKPDEVLIIGSHLDSVNWAEGTSERAPGADDNASGTATNLEIFRLLMANDVHPQRTIEIHAYAAEELGLIGSQDLAAAYQRRGVNVVAMVQYDMDLYTAPGEERKIWLVSNNTNPELTAALAQLVDNYVGLPWETRYLGSGSSDHAAWHNAGFAAAFPFENPSNYNHHIHSAQDTTAASGDQLLAVAFAKLGAAYVLHFAGF